MNCPFGSSIDYRITALGYTVIECYREDGEDEFIHGLIIDYEIGEKEAFEIYTKDVCSRCRLKSTLVYFLTHPIKAEKTAVEV